MSYEDPKARDPRFPDRPTHPDFARLSHIVQYHDIRVEQMGQKPFGVLGVDEESFLYFVENRLGILGQRTHRTFEGRTKALMVALYMDAFALGQAYAEEGTSTVGVDLTVRPSEFALGDVILEGNGTPVAEMTKDQVRDLITNLSAAIADDESGEDV